MFQPTDLVNAAYANGSGPILVYGELKPSSNLITIIELINPGYPNTALAISNTSIFVSPLLTTANITVNGAIIANGSIGSLGQLLASAAGGNVYWTTAGATSPIGSNTQIAFNNSNTETGDANLTWIATTGILNINGSISIGNAATNNIINSTSYSGTANNTLYVGTISAANIISNGQLSGNLGSYQTSAGLSSNVAKLTANNASYLGTVIAASYANTTNTNATNITSGTLPWAQAPSGTANLSASQTFAGNTTFSANLIAQKIQANSSIGTSGQALLSGGTSSNVHWGNAPAGTSWSLIASANLIGPVVSSVQFSSIPTNYSDLILIFKDIETFGANGNLYVGISNTNTVATQVNVGIPIYIATGANYTQGSITFEGYLLDMSKLFTSYYVTTTTFSGQTSPTISTTSGNNYNILCQGGVQAIQLTLSGGSQFNNTGGSPGFALYGR